MLQCAYAIFCEEASVNTTTQQVSAKEFFSNLSMKAAGTAQFSFVVGVWGVPKGKTAAVELLIETPEGRRITGKWRAESKDENVVQNIIFNLSKMPLMQPGKYLFRVIDKTLKKEISLRVLTVTFQHGEANQ